MSEQTGTPQETGPEQPSTESTSTGSTGAGSTTRWIVIAVVVVALVLFIAWARRNPPFDDRDPGPDDASTSLVIEAVRGPNGGAV